MQSSKLQPQKLLFVGQKKKKKEKGELVNYYLSLAGTLSEEKAQFCLGRWGLDNFTSRF